MFDNGHHAFRGHFLGCRNAHAGRTPPTAKRAQALRLPDACPSIPIAVTFASYQTGDALLSSVPFSPRPIPSLPVGGMDKNLSFSLRTLDRPPLSHTLTHTCAPPAHTVTPTHTPTQHLYTHTHVHTHLHMLTGPRVSRFFFPPTEDVGLTITDG